MTATVLEPDDTITDRYTCGDCDVLALAIHRLTGWRMVGLGAWWEVGTEFSWFHAVVELPDGRYLDIEGIRDAEALMSRWDNAFDPDGDDHGIYDFPDADRVHAAERLDAETVHWAEALVALAKSAVAGS